MQRSSLDPRHRSSHRRAAVTVMTTVTFMLAAVSAPAFAGPTVATDQSDYYPGDIAYITGSGFHASEAVTLQVVHTDDTAEGGMGHDVWDVTTDDDGNFISE